MGKTGMAFTQINLHHSKGASAVLARRLSVMHTAISLIQEPWLVKDSIRGLAGCGKLYKAPGELKPRACIAIKGIDAEIIPVLCSRDVVSAELKIMDEEGREKRVVVCSAYFDGMGTLPPHPLEELVHYCQENRLPLVVGCDANAHHTIWGSTNTNRRGEELLEYLASTDLEILNKGSEPTFCTAVRREVLDLTICSRQIVEEVTNWRVSTEPSLSDHRQIIFRLDKVRPRVICVRNPKMTNWDSFRSDLGISLKDFPKRHGNAAEIELCVEHLQRALVESYEKNCPTRTVTNTKNTSWWNPKLQDLRKATRRAWNRARNTGRQSDWDLFKRAQKDYRDSVIKAKRNSWEKFCETVKGLPETARLCRILARNPDAALEAIRLPNGRIVTGEQCLVHLLEENFPGFRREAGGHLLEEMPEHPVKVGNSDWKLAAIIVRPDRVKRAVNTFGPFKSAGPDQVFPALLQEGLEQIVGPLTRTLRACIALGYTPSAWKLAKVVFIPKAGKTGYTSAKDFRPICLTSFILKTLEKLIDVYVREVVLEQQPLHSNQHAYRTGFSTDTALHSAISVIEEQLERKGYVVGTFLDIEGAFNNTPHEVVCREAALRGVPVKLVEWIRGMLGRRVTASLGTARITGWVGRGCPQGGVLSPLLWCLVADRLLRTLNDRGFYTLGYADDLAILVRGPFLEPLLELTQGALEVVEEWCQGTSLSVNPLKTGLVIFTRRYKVGPIEGPVLGGVRLAPTDSVKYLGVTLDRKLSWKEHLEERCRSVNTYFWVCRRTFGQTWGLKPKMVIWIYTAILRPRLLYASVVWWPRVQKSSARIKLEHTRALILRGALGAMRTTPVAAMGTLLGIGPLHLEVIAAAAMTAHRLRCERKWGNNVCQHTKFPKGVLSSRVLSMGQDRMAAVRIWERAFDMHFPGREEWIGTRRSELLNGDIWYTDGSKTSAGTGAGIYSRQNDVEESIPLGEFATVFQAEVVAIMRCAQTALSVGGVGRRIKICSDSQAAIKALGAPIITSQLTLGCRQALELLAQDNKVTLVWVPGHSGIKGNERADVLAKAGSETEFLGPEPALGVPFCLGRGAIRDWLRDENLRYWKTETVSKCRQARALIGELPRQDLAGSIVSLSRRDARRAVQILTGHGTLKYHMHKLGVVDNPNCGLCGEEETSLHVLGQCPAHARLRLYLLGSAFLGPEQLRQLSIGDLLLFWKRAGYN